MVGLTVGSTAPVAVAASPAPASVASRRAADAVFERVMAAASAALGPTDAMVAASPRAGVGSGGRAVDGTRAPSLTRALGALGDSQERMQKIVELALSGRQFSPQELLALQAGVYRFSQELELAGKVVEKVTSGVKQTLSTQV
jgi:hypothetical protein